MIIRPSVAVLAVCLPAATLAELRSLDESTLSAVSGQAGITVEFEGQLDIGNITYTDEGSLSVNEFKLGGAGRDDLFVEGYMAANGGNPFIQNISDKIDDLKIDIDVAADGEMSIRFYPLNYAAPVDFSITTGAWDILNAEGERQFTLVDNFSLEGIFTQLWAKVGYDDELGQDRLNLELRMGIDDLDFEMPAFGIGIRDLRMTGPDYDTNPNLLSANAEIEANIYNGTRRDGGGALALDIVNMDADITVGAIDIGGQSIGSVKIDNMNLTNHSMRIYGH